MNKNQIDWLIDYHGLVTADVTVNGAIEVISQRMSCRAVLLVWAVLWTERVQNMAYTVSQQVFTVCLRKMEVLNLCSNFAKC